MTRNIFGPRLAENYGVRPAYQNIGTLLAVNGEDPMEVLAAAGCDFSIEKHQLGREWQGEFIPTEGEFALVRRDHGDDGAGSVLGLVGSQYEAIGPHQVVETFAPLDYTLTHLGMVGNDFLMIYDVSRFDLAGDEVVNNLVIRAPQDGGGALTAMFTPLRMFCTNQLVLAARMATFNIGVPHYGRVDEELAIARYVVSRVEKAQRETTEVFQAFIDRVLTDDEAEQIIAAAYPYPSLPDSVQLFNEIMATEPDETEEDFLILRDKHNRALERYEYARTRVDAFRDGARQMLARTNEEVPHLANTAWAVWAGGVAATATWRNGARSVDYSTLFGYRADEVRSGFEAAMRLVFSES